VTIVVEVRIENRIHSVQHPFYVRIHRAKDNTSSEDDDDGEWIEAGKLRIGDEIRRANGDWAKVESVTQRNDGAKVYNFEVADNHNYFVGQTHLLAHNTCFLSARELARRLNVTEREFHRKIKRQILNKVREAVNELRSRNPDIGISEKGTIVIRDPRNRSRSIDTGISFDDFVQ
jgi:hypothetical protein